eukprot:6185168-Pleurochrysis_carterae.AAC.1
MNALAHTHAHTRTHARKHAHTYPPSAHLCKHPRYSQILMHAWCHMRARAAHLVVPVGGLCGPGTLDSRSEGVGQFARAAVAFPRMLLVLARELAGASRARAVGFANCVGACGSSNTAALVNVDDVRCDETGGEQLAL